MVTVARPFIILLISRSLLFFSLFSVLNKLSNFSSPHLLLFPQIHTQTHPHRQINTEIHLLKKKKKKKHRDTQTHPHTNKPKRTNNKETDRCLSELMGLAWSELVGMGHAWSELGRSRIWLVLVDRSLWVWVLPDWSYGSVLMTKMVWIRPNRRVDLCLGIEMGIEREQQIRKNG